LLVGPEVLDGIDAGAAGEFLSQLHRVLTSS
jgi:hypothetical protein